MVSQAPTLPWDSTRPEPRTRLVSWPSEHRDGGLFLVTYGYAEGEIEVITDLERKELYVGVKPQIVSLCRSYYANE
jgi:hypothetical protein